MIQIPDFVLSHLISNNFINKTRTLIIGENYPGKNYAKSYFYRSIPECPGGPSIGPAPAYFTNLCDRLLVPNLSLSGIALTELERLNKFLDSGFLLIDAQDNLIPPIRPAALTPDQIDDLMKTILMLNPKSIMFLTNNNIPVIASLSTHLEFPLIQNRILNNTLNGTQVFSFPSSPANPNLFTNQINHLRGFYFL